MMIIITITNLTTINMRKKTNNRHGAFGLQVLLLMLVMLVGGGSTA